MKAPVIVLGLAALMIAAPAAAQQRRVDEIIERFDKNKNGIIEQDEIPANLRQTFRRFDANRDGQLTKQELSTRPGRRNNRPGEAITGPARGERIKDSLKVGDAAPDFTLADPQGKREVTLSSFRGKKPVVLIFGSYT